MSISCVSERFAKLRAMREKLCSQETNWKEAFQARDWLLDQLNVLSKMMHDESVGRDELLARISDILCVLDPEGKEANDV